MNKSVVVIFSIIISLFSANFAFSRENVTSVGSSTVYPFTTLAAEKFAKLGNPSPVVESTGTGGGMKLFCAGIGLNTPDLTGASRAIKSSEAELCEKNGVTPLENLIGYDGITFSNSNKAEKFSLTKEEIFKAVARKILDRGKWVENGYVYWSNINPDLPKVKIDILVPPPSSGTRDAFVELVMHSVCKKIYKMPKKGDDGYKKNCSSLREDGAVIEAGENDNLIVEKLNADINRFGVFGFSFLDQNKDKVQGSIVDGVAPTFDTIADGSYKVSRPLFFYVKKEHIGIVPGLQEFVDFYNSDAIIGQDGAASSRGLIPLAK